MHTQISHYFSDVGFHCGIYNKNVLYEAGALDVVFSSLIWLYNLKQIIYILW